MQNAKGKMTAPILPFAFCILYFALVLSPHPEGRKVEDPADA
jgi:hypothetical protein